MERSGEATAVRSLSHRERVGVICASLGDRSSNRIVFSVGAVAHRGDDESGRMHCKRSAIATAREWPPECWRGLLSLDASAMCLLWSLSVPEGKGAVTCPVSCSPLI